MENTARLRNIYKMMKHRCNDIKYDKYNYYGGRGIAICESWDQSYYNFEKWALSHGYEDGLTLDRIDNDKGYGPNNCRWVTMKEQANNRSTNHMITYKGKTQSLAKWADELKISVEMLYHRIYDGWSVERALTEPNHNIVKSTYITYKGKTKRMFEWAKELKMQYNTLCNRINVHHWPIEKAIETPVVSRNSSDQETLDNE